MDHRRAATHTRINTHGCPRSPPYSLSLPCATLSRAGGGIDASRFPIPPVADSLARTRANPPRISARLITWRRYSMRVSFWFYERRPRSFILAGFRINPLNTALKHCDGRGCVRLPRRAEIVWFCHCLSKCLCAFDDSRNIVHIFIYLPHIIIYLFAGSRKFEKVRESVKMRIVENKITSFNRQTS
jgi:hypothetical protein